MFKVNHLVNEYKKIKYFTYYILKKVLQSDVFRYMTVAIWAKALLLSNDPEVSHQCFRGEFKSNSWKLLTYVERFPRKPTECHGFPLGSVRFLSKIKPAVIV